MSGSITGGGLCPEIRRAGLRAHYDRPVTLAFGRDLPARLPDVLPGDGSSLLSLCSKASVLSVGSVGSVLSVGSVGSVLSVGSAGSALSVFSAGSWLSAGSLLSARSFLSVLSWRSSRGMLVAGTAVAVAGTALLAHRRAGRA